MSGREKMMEHKGKMKLRDRAYKSFIQHLLDSKIRPGQFLSQRELVDVTGMPLGAIRELIPRLEADKLIETVPQRGMQVTNIDLKLVRNAFQLWIVLAKPAAANFTQSASDEQIETLATAYEDILGRAEKQVDKKLLEDAKKLEWNLHDTFIESLGNEILSDIYRLNRMKIQLIKMERGFFTDRAILTSIQEHVTIIEALKARHTERVVASVEAHLDASLRRAIGI